MSLGYAPNEIWSDWARSDQLILVFAVEMSRTPVHVDSLVGFFIGIRVHEVQNCQPQSSIDANNRK